MGATDVYTNPEGDLAPEETLDDIQERLAEAYQQEAEAKASEKEDLGE